MQFRNIFHSCLEITLFSILVSLTLRSSLIKKFNQDHFLSVEAVFEYVDLSMVVFVSVPLEAGVSIHLPATQCSGNKPADLESFYGISGVNLGVSVGFLEKHLTLELPLGYSQMKSYS